MPYPGLSHDDHRILGSDFCSGFTDVYGKWNTGFYCPQESPTIPVFCCGTTYYKYCCIARSTSLNYGKNELEMNEDPTTDITPFTVRVPVVFAIFCGALAVVILLVTAICFFCSCCVVYKKRRGRDNSPFSGLYHIQGSSSTTSALASIYSTQNSNMSTPLDCGHDWGALAPGGGGAFTYIPYPYLTSTSATNFNQQHHYATPTLSSISSNYPSSLTLSSSARGGNLALNNNQPHGPGGNNNPSYFYNNLNNNQQNRRNQNCSSLSSIYSQQYHPNNGGGGGNGRPASVLSTYSSNSSFSTLPASSPGGSNERVVQQNPSTGLYHVTNLRTPPSSSGLGPPPAYSYRPTRSSNLPESVELQEQLQQLLSLQSSTGTRSRCNANVQQQQQTRFISQRGSGGVFSNSSSINTPTSQQTPVGNLNLRQFLLEQQRQQRSSNNVNNYNSLRIPPSSSSRTNQSGISNHPLSQQERQSLATIQSLINAYRSNCGGNGPLPQSLPPLPLQSSQPAGNPSLTTTDVNRLNAINLLVSAVLNQRQSGGGGSGCGESRRAVGSGSGEIALSRPLLALLDRVIRASSSFSSSGGGGSRGESVASNTTEDTATTATSGIGRSISSSGGSCMGSDTTLTKGTTIGLSTINTPLKIEEDVKCKNSRNILSFNNNKNKVVAGGDSIINSDDGSGGDYGEHQENQSERQNQIIQIIETSVPCKDSEENEEKCFDVDEDKIKGEDYISSLQEDEDEGKDDPKISSASRNLNTLSELSLEEETNLKHGSKLDCCCDEMDVNFKSDFEIRDVGKEKSRMKQETSVIIDELAGDEDQPEDITGKSCVENNSSSSPSPRVEIVEVFDC